MTGPEGPQGPQGVPTEIDVHDDGVLVVSGTDLDFAGAGVSVADVGGVAVVTIPGGGGGGGAPDAHAASHEVGGTDLLDLGALAGSLTPTQHGSLGTGDLHPEYVQKAVVDAKGDLLVGTAPDVVGRQAVGADGTLLSADSTQPSGLAWIPAPSGGLIAVQDEGAPVADVGTVNFEGAGVTVTEFMGTAIVTIPGGGGGGGGATVVTDIATITGEADGDLALVRAGNLRYMLVFDATDGKWYGEERIVWLGGGATTAVSAVAYAAGTIITPGTPRRLAIPWAALEAAGLTWEFQLTVQANMSGAGISGFARVAPIPADEATTYAIAAEGIAGTEVEVNSTASSAVRTGAWAPISDLLTPTDYLIVAVQARVNSGTLTFAHIGTSVKFRAVSR